MPTDTLASVKDYYGRVLSASTDLKTSACCLADAMPPYLRPFAAKIHDEVMAKFYGCGSPIPEAIVGKTVLDLGAGTGRDAFLCAALTGPEGRVVGVDMTDAQVDVARRHTAFHLDQFRLPSSVLAFHQGYIEDLASAGIEDASVDVVISNCVINLSPDKDRVFDEIFRVLKPGGELYFSDVFSDRRIPMGLRDDPVLLGECLSGALYVEDFRRMLAARGVKDARFVKASPIDITDADIDEKIGMCRFSSMTVRAFKLPLEDRCEDYGQVATYLGTIPHHKNKFVLDDHHTFERGRAERVCGNTADMLKDTRFGAHFNITSRGEHFGLFPCGPATSTTTENDAPCC